MSGGLSPRVSNAGVPMSLALPNAMNMTIPMGEDSDEDALFVNLEESRQLKRASTKFGGEAKNVMRQIEA